MAFIIREENCKCESCSGDTIAHKDYYGGSHCMCRCHELTGEPLKDFLRNKNQFQNQPPNCL